MARAFAQKASVKVFDEPSSALDPTLFISHRLSTTRIADRIYMLENGRIIEEGSHTELLARSGKSADMWKVRTGQYVS